MTDIQTPTTILKTIRNLVFIFFISYLTSHAQDYRSQEENTVSWTGFFATLKVSPKVGIYTEFQLRRAEFASKPLQDFYRMGINYQLHPRAQVRVGYAYAETYAYGEQPLNPLGKTFSEHRPYEMLTLNDKLGRFDIINRFMMEQRFIGRYNNAESKTEDEFLFSNRARYMIRTNIPLNHTSIKDKTVYALIYNEIHISFGKNIRENVFDQNRLGFGLGYRFNPKIRAEIGYINQRLQLAREVSEKNHFQSNNGLTTNFIFNLELIKNKKK
ncbi:MAG: DUF2490 domain-containing protein [Leadbetterella sp.]